MSDFKQRVREALCNAIATTLRRSGRQLPSFKDSDKPLKDYDGLDSLCGIEVTLSLEEALGIEDLGNNIFVKGTGKTARARSLSEIVSKVLRMTKGKE
jgi:hypothetical protein